MTTEVSRTEEDDELATAVHERVRAEMQRGVERGAIVHRFERAPPTADAIQKFVERYRAYGHDVYVKHKESDLWRIVWKPVLRAQFGCGAHWKVR